MSTTAVWDYLCTLSAVLRITAIPSRRNIPVKLIFNVVPARPIMRQKFVWLLQLHVNAAGRIGKENKHITILEIAEQLINFMLLAEITAAKRYKMIPRTICREEKVLI